MTYCTELLNHLHRDNCNANLLQGLLNNYTAAYVKLGNLALGARRRCTAPPARGLDICNAAVLCNTDCLPLAPDLSACRTLLDEAWLGRGDGEVVPGSVGDTSAGDDFSYPAQLEDLELTSAWDTAAAARELSEPDTMDFLDKMGTVYSNAKVYTAEAIHAAIYAEAGPECGMGMPVLTGHTCAVADRTLQPERSAALPPTCWRPPPWWSTR